MTRHAATTTLAAISTLALAACSARRPPTDPADTTPTGPFAPLAAEAEAQPIGRLQQSGLEAHWWLADDTDDAFARALSPAALASIPTATPDPPEFDPDALRRWRDSGLRVYSLPPGSLATLQAALPPKQAWERLWVGQPLRWQPLVAGRSLASSELIRVDGHSIPVPPGQIRLLARAWLTPDSVGSALHLELLPQIAQRNPALTLDPTRAPTTVDELEAGRVFGSLLLHARLTPGRVYAIVPVAPEERWDLTQRLASDAGASTGAGSPREAVPEAPALTPAGGDPPPPPAAYEIPEGPIDPAGDPFGLPYGPADAGPLTLGEAAFHVLPPPPSPAGTADASIALPPPKRRLIIVLLPRAAGEGYHLLP